MEHLPAASAEAANPPGGGSKRERNQQNESGKAYGDERALVDVLPHCGEIEALVGAEVGEEVEAGVEKGEEAEHAAKTDEVGEFEEFAERRDAESDDEEAESPIAGGVLNELDGIRAEICGERAPDEDAERHEAKKKDRNFGPLVGEERGHASNSASVIFLQVHAGVEAGDLVLITVEHEGVALEDFAEAAFFGLAPARMIDVGIHVGIEAVLVRVGEIPGCGRFFSDKFDFDDGLDALETVLPRNDHANGRAVLIGKCVAVHADAEERKRIHGFIEAKTFDVGEGDAAVFGFGHLAGIIGGFKRDVFCFFCGLDEIDDRAEGKTDPGNDDGPAFHAAMAVDALFERSELEDFVHGEFAFGFDFAFDGDGPRRGAEFLGVFGGSGFVDAEFVEIVVMRYVFQSVLFFGGAERAF